MLADRVKRFIYTPHTHSNRFVTHLRIITTMFKTWLGSKKICIFVLLDSMVCIMSMEQLILNLKNLGVHGKITDFQALFYKEIMH